LEGKDSWVGADRNRSLSYRICQVGSKDGRLFSSYEEVPEADRKFIRQSNFPPKNVAEMSLERWYVTDVLSNMLLTLSYSLRIYPHLQNTGAFFVAVLEKKAAITAVDRAKADADFVEPQQIITAVKESEETTTEAAKRTAAPEETEEPESKRLRSEATTDEIPEVELAEAEAPEKSKNPDGPFTLLPADNPSIKEIR
jgi:multisite-specific tRNA:(cytosine-C5)-methyltransferase